AAPAVALTEAQGDIEFPVWACGQLDAGGGEYPKTCPPCPAGLKVGEAQFARGRERQGAIEKSGTDAQGVVGPHGIDLRFGDSIPVLQRGIEIVLKKIDGSKEIVSVGVVGIQAQGSSQPGGSIGILLLLEGDAAELDGKTFIARGDPTSREKSVARVVEPAELRQGAAVVVVDVGVVCGWARDLASD